MAACKNTKCPISTCSVFIYDVFTDLCHGKSLDVLFQATYFVFWLFFYSDRIPNVRPYFNKSVTNKRCSCVGGLEFVCFDELKGTRGRERSCSPSFGCAAGSLIGIPGTSPGNRGPDAASPPLPAPPPAALCSKTSGARR